MSNAATGNIITIMHSCGHEIEYRHSRGSTGEPERHEVPLNCPECEEKEQMLQCAICKGRHTRRESVISGVANVAVGKECLRRRVNGERVEQKPPWAQ